MPPKSTPLLSKPKFTPKTPAPTKKPPTGPQATDTDKGINATPAQKKARANAKADRKANGINFMVFCDGTGNNALDDEKTKTNVHRLFNCVGNLAPAQAGDAVGAGVEEDEEDEDEDPVSPIEFAEASDAESEDFPPDVKTPGAPQDRAQIAIYQQGIGTTPEIRGKPSPGLNISKFTAAQKKFQALQSGGDELSGTGIEANVAVLYWFVCKGWQAGDKLFVFGFSRGAYTAQLLSALVSDIGVVDLREEALENVEDELIFCGKIVEEWASEKGELTGVHLSAIKDYITPVPKIEAVALFDMVSALGTPTQLISKTKVKKFTFADTLRPSVQHAFHALAITEHRKNFPALVWKKIPNNGKQCWFVGHHTAIGAGPKAGVTVGNLTLIWMISQLRDIMGIDEHQLDKYLAESKPGAAFIPDSKKGKFKALGDYYRAPDVGSKTGNPGNEYIHLSARPQEFTGLTRIPTRGSSFKKVLVAMKHSTRGWTWKTTLDAEVPEDVPSAFETEKLNDIRDQVEQLGPFPESGKDPEGTHPTPDEPVAKKQKLPSGKKLEKNPVGGLNARSGRDAEVKPTVRGQKEAEAAFPKKLKKKKVLASS